MTAPPLHQSYAAAVPELSVPHRADAPPAARLVFLNEPLAVELGFDPDWLRSPAGISLLTGQTTNTDAHTEPAPVTTAQAYAGYQFGQPSPSLGDGRAVLLGDLVDTRGVQRDLHLKGPGRTPFSRPGADGKAPLGPMLREAVIGEALHGLGIPTTRALAVLTTGERIQPRRGITPEPGALLVRVASSHLRVGTFEYAAWHHRIDVRRALLDYVIDLHYPQARGTEIPALAVLGSVMRAQAGLIAQWMLVGFVHGVMNTDNMALSGESIDFGPCAFLDEHRTGAVFSSIDRGGRYAYGKQPGIALWNLSRFAEALLQLIDPNDPGRAVDAATAVLERFEPLYLDAFARGMAVKLGIPIASGSSSTSGAADLAAVRTLGEGLLAAMDEQRVDHTGFFRALAEGAPAPFDHWQERLDALRGSGPATDAAREAMTGANPIYIPRNAQLERALCAAELGDLTAVEQIIDAVRSPFTRRPGLEHLEAPGEGADQFVTFCGT